MRGLVRGGTDGAFSNPKGRDVLTFFLESNDPHRRLC
jgi:hypothetical protein